MPSYFSEILSPTSVNTPLWLLATAGMLLRGGDGGLFRFSNVWGASLIMFTAAFSSGFDYPINDRETSAKLGMVSGFLFAVLPEVRMVRPVVSRRYCWGIGGFYVVFHGARYYQEINYYEDAKE